MSGTDERQATSTDETGAPADDRVWRMPDAYRPPPPPAPPFSWPTPPPSTEDHHVHHEFHHPLDRVTGRLPRRLRIAVDWLVLQLTGSVSAVGLSVSLQFAPVLVLGLFGGALVDRFDPRRLLLLSQSMVAAMAAVLAVLVLTDRATVCSK